MRMLADTYADGSEEEDEAAAAAKEEQERKKAWFEDWDDFVPYQKVLQPYDVAYADVCGV